MIIDLLCSDFSNHRVARTFCVAEVLAMDHDVRLWGWTRKGQIWPPLASKLDGATVWEERRLPAGIKDLRKMASELSGDVIYAFKPLTGSFGVGLLARKVRRRPLILDIDDWEPAFARAQGTRNAAIRSLRHASRWHTPLWVWALDRSVRRADAITTVSSFLQSKYGGTLLPHGRDSRRWDPTLFDSRAEKRRMGLPEDRPVVIFLGTPRPHKGLEDLVAATVRIQRECPVLCLLVGGSEQDEFVRSLMKDADGCLRVAPMCGFDELPRILSAGDLVVLPQRDDPRSLGQVPAKLFDAMAMAKPIVSTRVSEIPSILGECGILIEPGDVAAMSDAMKRLASNPDLAHRLGASAREKFVRQYSFDAMREILRGVLTQVGQKR